MKNRDNEKISEFFDKNLLSWEDFDIDNLDKIYKYKQTLLQMSSKSEKDLEVFTLLLKRGANPNILDEYGKAVIHHLVEYDTSLVSLEVLLTHDSVNLNLPSSNGLTPIFYADKNARAVELLIKSGKVDPNVVIHNKSPLVHFCSTYGFDNRLIDSIKMLLQNNADVNSANLDGKTPLHIVLDNLYTSIYQEAKNSIYKAIISMLLEKGAKVNYFDNKGNSPLFYCLKYTDESETIAKLLKYGADVENVTNLGEHALNFCSHQNVIKLLVQECKDINKVDRNGKTFLHSFISYDCVDKTILELLIENGANILAKDKDGKSPLQLISQSYGDDEKKSLLLEHGGGSVILDVKVEEQIEFIVADLLTNISPVPLSQLMRQKLNCNFKIDLPIQLLDFYLKFNPKLAGKIYEFNGKYYNELYTFFLNPSKLNETQQEQLLYKVKNTYLEILLNADNLYPYLLKKPEYIDALYQIYENSIKNEHKEIALKLYKQYEGLVTLSKEKLSELYMHWIVENGLDEETENNALVAGNAVSIANTNDYNFGDIIMGGAAHKIDVWTKDSFILKDPETNTNATLTLQGNITVGSINTHNILNINLYSDSVLTLSGIEYNCAISDPNSTGHIIVNPNLSISSNGSWGTTDQPIGTLTIGNNSTLTLTDHLYVNSLTIDDGASIIPPEMVHVMGENIDTNL